MTLLHRRSNVPIHGRLVDVEHPDIESSEILLWTDGHAHAYMPSSRLKALEMDLDSAVACCDRRQGTIDKLTAERNTACRSYTNARVELDGVRIERDTALTEVERLRDQLGTATAKACVAAETVYAARVEIGAAKTQAGGTAPDPGDAASAQENAQIGNLVRGAADLVQAVAAALPCSAEDDDLLSRHMAEQTRGMKARPLRSPAPVEPKPVAEEPRRVGTQTGGNTWSWMCCVIQRYAGMSTDRTHCETCGAVWKRPEVGG